MREYLAVDANEHVIVEPKRKPRYIRFAHAVSNILGPAAISLPFVILVAFYHARNTISALLYAFVTLFFLSIGPLAYVVIGVRLGKLSDVDVSRRSERAGPFLFGIASVLIGLVVLLLMQGPKNLQTVLMTTAISGILMLIITLWWKISIHASSLGGAATMLTVLYGAVMLPLFLLVILVSWSRVALHRHTISQVIAGSLMSIVLSLLVLKVRGV